MSLIDDIRAVSGNAVEQLVARFAELPRPVLAAIGAGDMAVERLAELREVMSESLGDRVSGISAPSIDVTDVRSAASDLGAKVSDLPAKAQKVAADVAGGLEQFAALAPGKAQEFIAQMPDKLTELQAAAQSLSPDALRETVDAYGHLAGMIYGNLAERGGRTWTRVRSSGAYPGVVEHAATAPVAPRAATPPGPAAAAKAPTAPKAPTVRPPAVKPAAVKPATVKPAAVKPAAVKPAVIKPTPAAPAAKKPVPKRPTAKAADQVVPKAAPKFVAAKQTVRKSAGGATVMPVVETVVVTPTGRQG